MLTLQEMSDRLEIQELFARYAHAVDSRDWAALKDVFTEDAVVDYSAMGGPRGTVPEVCAFLAEVLPLFPATQHLVANMIIELDGDRATARTMCHNPMPLPDDGGLLQCGLWYLDRLVRTGAGWRLAERSEEKAYQVVLKQATADQ